MAEESKFKKQKINHFGQKNKKQYLGVGQKGFLATCNFREKECVRECYNVLNQYADEFYGKEDEQNETKNKTQENTDEDFDIEADLQKNIEAVKNEQKSKNRRFQSVCTDTTNCIFIKTSLDNPIELGVKIVRTFAENKRRSTRYLLRFIPVEIVCKANLKDMIDAAGQVFDKYFLNESHTYSIIFNKRYNNSVKRDDVIQNFAELINSKNLNNKVNLKSPELSVVVEVIKGFCCITVLPEYIHLKKYNLVELCNKNTEKPIPANTDNNSVKEETQEKAPQKNPDSGKQENSSKDNPDGGGKEEKKKNPDDGGKEETGTEIQ